MFQQMRRRIQCLCLQLDSSTNRSHLVVNKFNCMVLRWRAWLLVAVILCPSPHETCPKDLINQTDLWQWIMTPNRATSDQHFPTRMSWSEAEAQTDFQACSGRHTTVKFHSQCKNITFWVTSFIDLSLLICLWHRQKTTNSHTNSP